MKALEQMQSLRSVPLRNCNTIEKSQTTPPINKIVPRCGHGSSIHQKATGVLKSPCNFPRCNCRDYRAPANPKTLCNRSQRNDAPGRLQRHREFRK